MPETTPAPTNDRLLTPVRWLGFVEGVSLLLLLFVAMPLKYAFGQPAAVEVVGMAHGVLFLLFVAALLFLSVYGALPPGRAVLGVLASIVPGGPWLLDHRIYPPAGGLPRGGG